MGAHDEIRAASPRLSVGLLPTFLTVAGMFIGLAACQSENRYVAPPPPKVVVAKPVRQPINRALEATGNTAAVNSANLVARVQGFVQSIEYKDGDSVKKGAKLFVIEPEPYQLKLQQSQAAEESAQATLTKANSDFDRQSDLVQKQISPQTSLEASTATRDASQAALKQSQVDVKQAQINLGYTTVMAPFDGIVTARQVSVGELVGNTGTPTVLATIVQFDPIYVNFSISETDLQRVRYEIKQRGLTEADLKQIPVEVGLQTETGYPHKGTLDYASPTVNPATGTLAVRGVLANANRALLPGYFVRVRVPERQQTEVTLVPDVAIGADQAGRYVLVVGSDNVVEQKRVQAGELVGDMRVIDSGVTVDDRVIVSGLLRTVPGLKVDPQDAPASAAAKK